MWQLISKLASEKYKLNFSQVKCFNISHIWERFIRYLPGVITKNKYNVDIINSTAPAVIKQDNIQFALSSLHAVIMSLLLYIKLE